MRMRTMPTFARAPALLSILSSLLLFAAAPSATTSCMALSSPLLYGHGRITSTNNNNLQYGNSNRRRRSIHNNIGHIQRPNNNNPLPLRMVGGGGGSSPYSPEPQQPQQSQTDQRQWNEYLAPTPDFEIPTTTQQEPNTPGQISPRPKIVVFGASGRIGRRIIQKLLSSGVDMDVVAFVRDEKKLEKVLYDEQDLVMDNLIGSSSSAAGGKNRKSGPRLQVVVSDVVSRRDVYQQSFETDDESKVLDDWVDKAQHYFTAKGWKNNNSTTAGEIKSLENETKVSNDVTILESGGEETLRDAISGATILISCLGSFRPSNVWTDYIRVPILRVFQKDVTQWCSDATHPYYVNYLTTKKILDEAEREQRRRSALLELEQERLAFEEMLKRKREEEGGAEGTEEEGFESEIAAGLRRKRNDAGLFGSSRSNSIGEGEDAVSLPKNGKLPSSRDRIKFIRISHLMVGHSPFRIWNVLTNIFWSQLSKFELMGEMLMEASTLVDTIVLRPGDLTDEKRNANHTSLQLCIDGTVESPSLVGREDVADLAVVAALTKTSLNNTLRGLDDDDAVNNETETKITPQKQSSAHHYTWALRWTGQHLSPPQGLRPDGLSSAALCFVKALKEQTKVDRLKRLKENKLKSYYGGKELFRLKQWMRRGGLKLYRQSLAISIPVYATIGLLSWYLFGQSFIDLFLRLKRLNVPQLIIKLLPS
mmetsp:Transcript_17424/g.37625  ORF Transcript_17424/g.37625 Transcript_17424/m.37625 type:complete len:706 (-) Transcript_17424:31-2148(-)